MLSVQAVAKTLKSVPLAVPVLENHRLDGNEALAQPVAHKDSIVACTLKHETGTKSQSTLVGALPRNAKSIQSNYLDHCG